MVAGLEVGVRDAVGDVGLDAAEVARKDQQPRPVKTHLHAAGPGRELEQVDPAPGEPRPETGELEAEHLGDSAVTADGAELAQHLEAKRPGGPAAHHAHDVLRTLPALALGELAGGRRGLAIMGIDDAGAVAGGPGIGAAAQAHVRLGEQPALFLGRIEPLNDGGGGAADRADNGASGDKIILQAHTLTGGELHAGIEFHGDARLFHLHPGEFAELRADFREQLVTGMDKGDGDIFVGDVFVESAAGADEVVDLARGLDATVTTPDHDKGQVPASPHGIVAHLGFFHLRDDVRAENGGVADGLQRIGMVGHARDDVQVGDISAGEDDVIVGELARLTVVALVFKTTAGQVDVFHLLGAAGDARQKLAEGHNDILQIQGRTHGVGQQGAEDKVILLVEQNHLPVAVAQAGRQGLGAFHAAEASTDNDNALLGHGVNPGHSGARAVDCNARVGAAGFRLDRKRGVTIE